MTACSLVCALLVAALSRVNSALELYLVMGGIGLARAAVLYDPAFAVVVRWFHAKRSTALLTLTVVAGFASTTALPASNALIIGWPRRAPGLALVLAMTTVVPHALVLRTDPVDVGQYPDGASPTPAAAPGRRGPRGCVVVAGDRGVGVGPAGVPVVRSRVRVPGCGRDCGRRAPGPVPARAWAQRHVRRRRGRRARSPSVSGRLVLTGVVRRVPVAVVAVIMFAVQGAGVGVLLAAWVDHVGCGGVRLLFGLGFGVGTIARPALVAESFGVARYATLAGLLGAVTTLATTVGPVAAGAARTTSGVYTPVLVALVVVCAMAAVCLLRAARSVAAPDGGGAMMGK